MEFDRSGFRCDTVSFDIDTARFTADAAVTATVSCGVVLGDVSGMGIPGRHTITAVFTEPLDRVASGIGLRGQLPVGTLLRPRRIVERDLEQVGGREAPDAAEEGLRRGVGA